MIPLWLKVLWGIWLLLTWLMSIFTLSGFMVMGLTKASGEKFSLEKDLYNSVIITISMLIVAIVWFIATMIIYSIPFSEWIG